MYGRGRPFRPGRGRGFGFGGGWFLPFTVGALTGAALTPYRPYYPYYPPYPPYPYPYYY